MQEKITKKNAKIDNTQASDIKKTLNKHLAHFEVLRSPKTNTGHDGQYISTIQPRDK